MLKRLSSSTLSEFVDIKTSVFLLRVVSAFFIIYGHGWGKLMRVLDGNLQFLDPIGLGPEVSLILAVFAEAVCGFLLLIGFWSRFAALVLSINLGVAAFGHHIPAGDSFGGNLELALLYLLVMVVLFLLGPGKFSVDGSRSA